MVFRNGIVPATRDDESYRVLTDIATRMPVPKNMNMYTWHVTYAVIVLMRPPPFPWKQYKSPTNARFLYQRWLSNQGDEGTFFRKMYRLIETDAYFRITEDIKQTLYDLVDEEYKRIGPPGALDSAFSIRV